MLRHLLHQAGIHGYAADAASRSHQPVEQYGHSQPRRKRRKRHGKSQQQHGERNGPACSHPRNQRRSIKSAQERADAPSPVQPSIARRAGVEDAIAERRRDHHSGHHRAQKQSPAHPQENNTTMLAEKDQPFAHLAQKACHRGFRRFDIVTKFDGPRHHMPALAHREVAQKRNHIGAHVDEQDPAEADVFIDKSNQRAGNQPSSLDAREKKCIRLHERALGRQFLNQRRDRGPKHPEARRHQRIHQVEFPHPHAAHERQHHDRKNDDGAQSIQPHHQPPPVFAVDDDAGEGQHQHRGNRLQSRKRAQSHLGVSALQDRPSHRGGVHPAAQHGDYVRRKNKSQRAFLQDRAHRSNLTWRGVGSQLSALSYQFSASGAECGWPSRLVGLNLPA